MSAPETWRRDELTGASRLRLDQSVANHKIPTTVLKNLYLLGPPTIAKLAHWAHLGALENVADWETRTERMANNHKWRDQPWRPSQSQSLALIRIGEQILLW